LEAPLTKTLTLRLLISIDLDQLFKRSGVIKYPAQQGERSMSRTRIAVFAAAAAGGMVFSVYQREMTQIRSRLAQGSRFANTKSGLIEYAVRGSGSAALIIHGAGGGYDQGLFLANSFPEGIQAIVPSRFGYLRTPLPQDASTAAQADAHAALLDSLGIDRAIVAGASAGVPSAIEMALRHPPRVRALILLVPRGYAPDRVVEVPANRSNAQVLKLILSGADFAYWLALRIARRKLVQFMGVPPELEAQAPAVERERVNAILRGVLPLSYRIAGINNDSETVMTPLPLERIGQPTLIITTKDDLFGTLSAAQYMAEKMKSAKLMVLESGGHFFVGSHLQVHRAISEFLNTVDRYSQTNAASAAAVEQTGS
jgi:2-hydroxy-6-oxonona-2,4-dienedioate hydrolase